MTSHIQTLFDAYWDFSPATGTGHGLASLTASCEHLAQHKHGQLARAENRGVLMVLTASKQHNMQTTAITRQELHQNILEEVVSRREADIPSDALQAATAADAKPGSRHLPQTSHTAFQQARDTAFPQRAPTHLKGDA